MEGGGVLHPPYVPQTRCRVAARGSCRPWYTRIQVTVVWCLSRPRVGGTVIW